MNGSVKMHVKNIYPLNTTDEELMRLAEMVSYYLSNIAAVHAASDISTAPTGHVSGYKNGEI